MLSNLSLRAAMATPVSGLRLTLAVLALAAGLAACSSSKQSAPIEVRTPQQARPVARPDVARRDETPAAGVTPASPSRPSADKLAAEKAAADKAAADKAAAAQAPQTGAIKQGSAESRPLTSPPATPATTSAPAATATPASPATAPVPASGAASPSAVTVKSGPRGSKRPYSEATLAEMRQAELAGAGAATTPAAVPAASARPDAKAEVKPDARPEAKSDTKADPKADGKSDGKSDAKAGSVTFAWPGKGKVLAGFSEPRQMGLSIDGAIGDPVLSAADGKVIFSGVGPRGFGNLIIVKHDGELLSVYAHNKALLVKDGQTVKKGQKIAELGDSGTDRPQLHFEIRRQGKPVDPRPYLPPR